MEIKRYEIPVLKKRNKDDKYNIIQKFFDKLTTVEYIDFPNRVFYLIGNEIVMEYNTNIHTESILLFKYYKLKPYFPIREQEINFITNHIKILFEQHFKLSPKNSSALINDENTWLEVYRVFKIR